MAHTIVLKGDPDAIILTIPDDTADFGSNLGPDGRASNSTDTVNVLTDTAGACYYWSGSVEVESTIRYRVEVTAADTKPRLRFHDTVPAGYAGCAAGERVDSNMFPGGSPAGTWIDDQTSTGGRTHPLTLGLDARWSDAPDPNLGDTTITFTGIPDAF